MSSEKDAVIQLMELKMHLAFGHGIDIDKRAFRIVGEINQDMFEHVDACLSFLEAGSRKPVLIKINSEGGSVYDAFAIISRMKSSPCTLITEGHGCIMSAAGLILASGDKRRMSSLSRFMYHEISTILDGNVSKLKHEIKELEKEQVLWAELMAELTAKTKEFWLISGGNKDLYLSADEALNYKVVDEVF